MTPEIEKRIKAVQAGRVPAGYCSIVGITMPKEWNLVKLGSIFGNRIDVNHSDYELLSITADKGVIPRSLIADKDNSSEDKSKYKHICVGDIGYNTMRMWQGVCALSAYDGIVSPAYTILSPSEGICAQYFAYLFKMQFMINLFYRNSQGLVDDTRCLKYEWFKNIEMKIPSLSEQKKIAEILSTQDRVIELKEKLIAEKQSQKKYLTQTYLMGKMRSAFFQKKWKYVYLSEILKERKECNELENLRICSVAVNNGVVDQKEHLGKSMAAENTSNYAVVHYGDIVYTKSPTGTFPYGIIKQSQLKENVAVSPLYGVYEPYCYEIGYLLQVYFSYANNANNYLKPIVNKGAKNTILISNQTFLKPSLYLPIDIEEIKYLYKIFKSADEEISLLQKDLEQEKLKKKSLMQLLLTGLVRVKV